MVYFTCQHCGDSVNKPRVEKHYDTKCRYKTPNLTCVDCLKDFRGYEYKSHNECVTEAERYSAKGTVIKQTKGKQKQVQYIEIVQSLLNSKKLTVIQRQILEVCSSFDNVPRKLKKFQNFMSNVARKGQFKAHDIEAVFHLLEATWKSETNDQTQSNAVQNGENHSADGNHENINNRKQDEENTSIQLNQSDSITVDVLKGKKVKDKKERESLQTAEDEKMEIEMPTNPEETKENGSVMTKKQLKKQKKYEKYLLELNNEATKEDELSDSKEIGKKKKKSKMVNGVENGLNEENSVTEIIIDAEGKKAKKSKKHKKIDLELEQTEEMSTDIVNDKEENHIEESKQKKKSKKSKRQMDLEVNGNENAVHSSKNSMPEKKLKNKNKRKLEETESAEEAKKPRVTEDEGDNEGQTFDWTNVILRVLESKPDKELSIKRLGKKVIDEYQTLRPDHRTYEELLAKFNKKVNKTKGVRVLKDKAKLIE